MRNGTRLALDIGRARIGVARSDVLGSVAVPLQTINTANDGSDVTELVAIIEELQPLEIIVGLPLLMSGKEGEAARMARSYARRLARKIGPSIAIRLLDERLTSASAHKRLQEAGHRSSDHRKMVDQVAATLILEQALQLEANTGQAPGELVTS